MIGIYKRACSAGLWAIVILAGIIMTSCGNSKKIIYFKDVQDVPHTTNTIPFEDMRIRPGDILSISVQTIDPKSTELFAGTGPAAVGGTSNASGYVVDKEGYIEMPLVGKVKVEGQTLSGAREQIREAARVYYKDPIVNVRIVNFQVTVMGEVNRPGTLTIINEKTSILDVIGLAGDLTVYGRRENILLVREENGKKIFARLDLNSSKIFESPYYYVRTGDYIYVEPNTVKARTATIDYSRDRFLSYAATLVSMTVLIVTYINNNR